MVKPDVKHNYYTDLELPNTCSIDDIKKQYRKLALQYHPDRNAGREEEFVPRFQAIQTAHEILGDALSKNKYDTDRRKAGLYPAAARGPPNVPPTPGNPTGNPYFGRSDYPPPPRRTQPGPYARPQPTAAGSSTTTPTGADRFTQFTRGAPTARKDAGGPAAGRADNFRAWQNLNAMQEKEKRDAAAAWAARNQPVPPTQPSPGRPRPPPRQDTKLPSEDEIRAGMNYRKPPPPPPAAEAEVNQSAWASFQRQNAGKPGVSRSNTFKTPRKQGFDPNAPGSDERPQPDSNYMHTHRRSADFGRHPPGAYPPPPPGPPPMSPTSPNGHRPFADPLRPFKARPDEQDAFPQAPYTEGNRTRTPYSKASGERTKFERQNSDGLRRSASTRDTTKLYPDGGAARARSTSPLGRQKHGTQDKNFVDYSDSDASGNGDADIPSTTTTPGGSRPGTAPHSKMPFERPMKVPTPPSRRANGPSMPFSPPADDADTPGMQQKTANNMYADPFLFQFDDSPDDSTFERNEWISRGLSTNPTYGTESHMGSVPQWKTPISELPNSTYGKAPSYAQPDPVGKRQPGRSRFIEASIINVHDTLPRSRGEQDEAALRFVQHEVQMNIGEPSEALDICGLNRLASTARAGLSCGHSGMDKTITRMLELFPSYGLPVIDEIYADTSAFLHSFNYPGKQNVFSSGKSRSEETVNTNFSPDGWHGSFKGSDYFAPPPPTSRKQPSPSRRTKSGLRSATANPPGPSAETNGAQSTFATEERTTNAQEPQSTPGSVKFSKEEWEQHFKEPTWVWPGPPQDLTSPKKAPKTPARNPSRTTGNASREGGPFGRVNDPVTDRNGGDATAGQSAATGDDGDAMDIDDEPPVHAQQTTSEDPPSRTDGTAEPRLYSVPPSRWRQQQESSTNDGHQHDFTSQRSTSSKFETNLDDLAHVEPLTRDTNGLDSLAGMSSTLPFQSQPSSTLPTHPQEPQKLQMPPVPKAPEPPHKLTKESWHTFTATFAAYLHAYHAFNTTMVQHFAAREQAANALMYSGSAWLEAVGDTTREGEQPMGFASYARCVREDEMVREVWGVGCERHRVAVEEFGKLRERVRRLVEGGGLVES
ncbi:hypothetical protein LTR86_003109 [Recurvomyces mirabilis]|nr:hypothetical protein LTR86_003109 [Recurvomyces mirabilis]